MAEMSPSAPHTTDVLVVGAGPTGLLLAGDLAEAGLSVTLLEARPHKISNLSRALVVHARALEQFDARGIADEVVKMGHPIDRLALFERLQLDPSRLPSRYPYVLFIPQYEVERVLERRARDAGVTFVYDAKVVGVDQDTNGVTARAVAGRDADPDGPHSTYRASYLVGTDGVHSTIRHAIGLPFPGQSILSSLILADLKLDRAPDRPFTVNAVPDGFALLTEMGDNTYRLTGWNRHHQLPDDAPLDVEEIKELLRLNFGTDYGITDVRWKSRFHSDERQAPAYRVGRVFLAGDAAHVHSPAGAMGMNTGLQDAANLSWKLVAVLRDGADDRLLDTYQAERHAVGKLVLRMSGTLVRTALLHGPAARLLRAAAGTILSNVRPLADKAAAMISGIGIAYRTPRGAHKLTGRRAPDVRLAEGRLNKLQRGGKFVLITPAGQEADAALPDHVVRAHWTSDRRRTTALVRPDGYFCWATEKPDDAAALRAALTTWAGPLSQRV
ncbi:2-polyprenyl-6-methoxyphenol hydroxylase-like FAD-dependent oxidoreductase [Nonomuraea polychroma]|uniref:2-polyprenyl-6-methoxyphenol hydroxylase-like FAD-dependent oxidoreductase n=1 Tax=Nonomuraea polychroma TaxID=46176 RepID=A0A438MGY5_9ACTN|nr:FAD-dependent monooxygenase [Nonomuraea polychroma]RVX45119.1 2-polyprenyl-6-methoxyphenol hydroxylase-like FAD-dependent oxidoreductase [Nonomuraea polychroma]